MAASLSSLFSPNSLPSFSGHETFALRSNWLKKAYDLLQHTPDLFSREDAFVLLGVGKNMAQSIRFWGRVCGVFVRSETSNSYEATSLGHSLLGEKGWDQFLVTPASRWLLHWQIVSRPEAAFTWFFTFNLLKGGEFTVPQMASQIRSIANDQGWRVPSDTTITRDIECMLNCYCQPRSTQNNLINEDLLLCPLTDLGLIQSLPGQQTYRIVTGQQTDLPSELVAFAILQMMHQTGRKTISFSELAYGLRSPGRIFRLDEDALLSRLQELSQITNNQAYYSDQSGIRQVAWPNPDDSQLETLLNQAFAHEVRYV